MKRFFLFAGDDGSMVATGANTFRGSFPTMTAVVEYVEEIGWGTGATWWNVLDVVEEAVIDPELHGGLDLHYWVATIDFE